MMMSRGFDFLYNQSWLYRQFLTKLEFCFFLWKEMQRHVVYMGAHSCWHVCVSVYAFLRACVCVCVFVFVSMCVCVCVCLCLEREKVQ